jgi:hypothetical protein
MFFIFETEDYHAFWMKDTFIPLSIAFIDKERPHRRDRGHEASEFRVPQPSKAHPVRLGDEERLVLEKRNQGGRCGQIFEIRQLPDFGLGDFGFFYSTFRFWQSFFSYRGGES